MSHSAKKPTVDAQGEKLPQQTEEFEVKGLPEGDYLINVHVFVDEGDAVGDETKFEILGNEGVQLCPANLF